MTVAVLPGSVPGSAAGLAGVLDPVLAVLSGRSAAGPAHVRIRPATPGEPVLWPSWLDPEVRAAFARVGIGHPWSHQSEAASLAWEGANVVLSTGPSSGKTVGYVAPALTAAVTTGGTTLYLSPTTALGADQAERLRRLDVPGVAVSFLSGDSPPEERRWAREHAQIVLTTPDLVHHSLLPGHERWARFLRRLRFVVVDECHLYRGVFGAHVSAVLRRLLRMARLRGATPVVIACSATAAEPAPFARAMCGVPFAVVDRDGSPHPGSAMLVHVPDLPAAAESAELLARLVGAGLQTAAFTSSRRGAETMARAARRRLDAGVKPADAAASPAGDFPDRGLPAGDVVAGRLATGRLAVPAGSVVSYRGGHLHAERRAVEAGLRDGSVMGVATTSALEVGVDVTGLDVVILDGWPGSVTALAQRAGRAGRGERPGVAVLVAGDDPIDAHLVADPDAMLARPLEAGVTDPDNPYVLAPHLALAALESPLTATDLETFGPAAEGIISALAARGDLRQRPGGWFWARGEPPAPVDLRAAAGQPITLVEAGTGRVLGSVDAARALEVAHPGAVYLHRFDTYVVDSLDLDERVSMLHAEDPGWITVPRRAASLTHLVTDAERAGERGPMRFGTVRVTRQVTGFTRRDALTGATLGEEELDLPERSFVTRAVTWRPVIEPAAPGSRAAALHAVEHVLVAMLPLVVPCDRWDVGAQVGTSPAGAGHGAASEVTVYDAWPGGAGFAERAFASGHAWLVAAHDRLAGCGCTSGCPSCVVAVGCERRNAELDKYGAARLLGQPSGCGYGDQSIP